MYLAYQAPTTPPPHPPKTVKKKAVTPKTSTPANPSQPQLAPVTAATALPAQTTPIIGTQEPSTQVGGNGMATQMTPLSWIAFSFVALLVVVLIITLWFPPKQNRNSPQVLRFLMALCAGFAGAFFTGNALVSGQYVSGGLTLTLSGAAGFAAFIIVWYGYKIVESLFPNLKPNDQPATMEIKENFTFKYSAQKIAESLNSGVNFEGFSKDELAAKLRPQLLEAKTWNDLLLALRAVTDGQAIHSYTVERVGSVFTLKVREE